MIGSAPLRVLLVEDEALIAMMAEDMIDGLGHRLVATAATLRDAMWLSGADNFDVALLDVNLNGESSMPVAAMLKERGTPLAFITGYGSTAIDALHDDVPILMKPYSIAELKAMLDMLGHQLDGTSSTTSTSDSNRG